MVNNKSIVAFLFIIFVCSLETKATVNETRQDSLDELNDKIESIRYDLNSIKRDRQNYQIEKNLLKNAYSSNLERINIVITIFLGIFGILGFLGIRDINKIKEKYETELEKLRELKQSFEIKSKEFDNQKEKFNDEIKEIIEENEKQSRRIKLIELKEKITTNINNGSLRRALEYCNAALDYDSEDTEVLMKKGKILCRQNKLEDSINTFKKARDIEPNNTSAITDITEAYLFNNQIEKSKEIISNNKDLFLKEDKEGLLKFFEAVEYYHKRDKEKLLNITKELIDYSNLESNTRYITGWNFKEALYFIAHQEADDYKTILQNLLWYLDGQISGDKLMSRIGLETEEENN